METGEKRVRLGGFIILHSTTFVQILGSVGLTLMWLCV